MILLELVTAAVATAALVLSLVNHRDTGAFVRARISTNMSMYGLDGRQQPGSYITINAYNVGRTEVSVTLVGLAYLDERRHKIWLMATPSNHWPAFGHELPHTLRPGHSVCGRSTFTSCASRSRATSGLMRS